MNGKTTEPGVLMVVDIGGSKYMPGFLDTEGKILYQESRSWTGDSPEEIMEQIQPTVDIQAVIRPVYNFKAGQ